MPLKRSLSCVAAFGLTLSLAATSALAQAPQRVAQGPISQGQGTVLPLPEAQATTPAPFQPVEPTRPLPVPPDAPPGRVTDGVIDPGEPIRSMPEGQRAPTPSQTAPPEPAPAPAATDRPSVDRQIHGDWVAECYSPTPDGPSCQIVSQVRSGDGAQTVLVFALARTGERYDVQVALPLGIQIGQGVRIEIADAFQGEIPISRCTAQGCLVEGTASPDLIDAMRRGRQAVITVWAGAQNPVRIPLSLNGFTAALEATTS